MATPTYDLLDSTTLGTAASSVTFSSINQSYGDLIVVVEFNTSNASGFGYAGIVVNNDTNTGNYFALAAYGNGSAAVGDTTTGVGYFYINGYYGTTTTTRCLSINQFFDYSATNKHKTMLQRTNTADYVEMQAGRWESTSAITTLKVESFSGYNFTAGSTFHLYGIAK